MRLWHKDLIDVLPRQQLLAQWRECCAIAANIANKGTPNHILVNKITDYSVKHLNQYAYYVQNEMEKRHYKVSSQTLWNFLGNLIKGEEYYLSDPLEDPNNINVYSYWMNDRYLIQCYYNLQEKYDCGGISEEEWKPIQEFYYNFIEKAKERERRRLERSKMLRNQIIEAKCKVCNNYHSKDGECIAIGQNMSEDDCCSFFSKEG